MSQIVVVIMVKNESACIRKTLDTVKDYPVFIYDTGSTDDTVAVCESYPNVTVESGEFVDFSTSRNACLDAADAKMDAEYYLLLDANDELRGVPDVGDGADVYLVRQEWNSGKTTTYFNVRLFRASTRCRYVGRVHEYITTPAGTPRIKNESFYIYQDRRNGAAESSVERWKRDAVLLEADVETDPQNARSVYYLAQTYDCLGNTAKAIEWYAKRFKMGDFYEERFLSALRAGRLSTDKIDKIVWFTKAFDVIARAEPMVEMAKIYRDEGNLTKSYVYALAACSLEYPKDALLSVDVEYYTYFRWHLLGIVAWYNKKYDEGRNACARAIAARGLKIDKVNKTFYDAIVG